VSYNVLGFRCVERYLYVWVSLALGTMVSLAPHKAGRWCVDT
jgi:hypothetical protein